MCLKSLPVLLIVITTVVIPVNENKCIGERNVSYILDTSLPSHNIGSGSVTELPQKMSLEMVTSGISVNPEKGSYMAMRTHKVPFRKTSGDAKKMVAAAEKYFKKLHGELKKVKDDIYGVGALPYKVDSKL